MSHGKNKKNRKKKHGGIFGSGLLGGDLSLCFCSRFGSSLFCLTLL